MFRSFSYAPSVALALAAFVNGQTPDVLGLANGFIDYEAGQVTGQIVRDSQTLASMKVGSGFDFLPSDFLANLTHTAYANHLGDVNFHYKVAGRGNWTLVASAKDRKAVTALKDLAPGVLAAADLAPTLPSGIPLKVTREWLKDGEGLALRVNLTNTGKDDVELGSLGLPVAINNIFSTRDPENLQQHCSLADPYIGLDAGYVRVSPVVGTGNALVVTPLGKSPLEAWRYVDEPEGDFGYGSQTYEATYEWTIHSQGWADVDWEGADSWNKPTSKTLKAGEAYSVGLRFSIAESIQTIEDAVEKAGIPLAIGLPGYVIPSDLTARLYLTHSSPVKSIDSAGAFTIKQDEAAKGSPYLLTPENGSWGRNKVTITYEDGKTQVVHYYIIKPATQTVADMGHFLTTAAHFTDEKDPFGRAPSIMTYDREANAIVSQEFRSWIAGLSDEGGTGAYIAAATKLYIQPVSREIEVLDAFVHDTVVGTIQPPDSFAVRASTFYYEPGKIDFQYASGPDYSSWMTWNKERAYTTTRAYNYVHPVIAYWTMYRVARAHPEVKTRSDWTWYINQAFNTVQHCLSNKTEGCDYGLTGLMGETVFGELLEDLKRENMTQEFTALEASMKYRAEHWDSQAVPFGSEMAWDSTGQEGVYYWTDYFGLAKTATKAIHSIVAYMPTVAHWGYNGNARRYWDFNYGGKLQGNERQIHHYGSGLNSLPLLHYYEKNPTDFNAIRVAYAGNFAPLSNIDKEGFPSAAFHSYTWNLKWDNYTGDYGLGFLGLGLGQTVYIVNTEKYGEVVFGGNVIESSDKAVVAEPRDAVRRRVFVADLGLKISLSAGAIDTITYDRQAKTVKLSVSAAATEAALKASSAIVWLTEPAAKSASFSIAGATKARGGFQIDLSSGKAEITIAKQ
ncbi:uncharacterized protein CTRU02_214530 [Colletotrichum truncatum]|uniref:Uncharacterized protein n=1 Tax=Colletotrichum truncatum TaxID=5467 RepID=A0ACC3YF40_COLTU|nr:uncharacterized protein CTRU02_12201 [Colletotrichum truncatum]KAF6784990.1 hypothetical protein CTRU02_12201 [Colletotrichum truncatum]